MYVFTLGEEAAKYAEKELGETEEIRTKSLEEIRNWLMDNTEINARTDDRNILDFLRACKFNIERSKNKLRNYYVVRTNKPEWFGNRDPTLPIITELIKLKVFLPLRELYDNKLVVIIRTSAHNPKYHSIDDVLKAGMMILDIASKECENASVYGVTAIFDMSDITLTHAGQLTPKIIKTLMHVWENYHCRPKQLEFINAPVYINVILNIFKKFLSQKLQKRINVHYSGLESLYKVIDIKILPEEYGGCGEKLDDLCDYWYAKLLSNKQWFEEDEKYKIDNNSN